MNIVGTNEEYTWSIIKNKIKEKNIFFVSISEMSIDSRDREGCKRSGRDCKPRSVHQCDNWVTILRPGFGSPENFWWETFHLAECLSPSLPYKKKMTIRSTTGSFSQQSNADHVQVNLFFWLNSILQQESITIADVTLWRVLQLSSRILSINASPKLIFFVLFFWFPFLSLGSFTFIRTDCNLVRTRTMAVVFYIFP